MTTYSLKSVTIRVNNSRDGIGKIKELWKDIQNGKLPLLCDNTGVFYNGIYPVSCYSGYESDENGFYDLSITGAESSFFQILEEKVQKGSYVKIEETGKTLDECSINAWQKVWECTRDGKIRRAYTEDWESTVPSEYTEDGRAHCHLYIAIRETTDEEMA